MPQHYKGRALELYMQPSLVDWLRGIALARNSDMSDAVGAVLAKARELEPPEVDDRARIRVQARVPDELRAELKRWPGRSLSDRFRILAATVRQDGEFYEIQSK